jgi:hypothetical protein
VETAERVALRLDNPFCYGSWRFLMSIGFFDELYRLVMTSSRITYDMLISIGISDFSGLNFPSSSR